MSSITTGNSAKAWAPDKTYHLASDVVPDALILSASTVSGEIQGDEPAMRVAYVDDAAAAVVAEGASIDESNPDLSEVLIMTSKIAQLLRTTNEMQSQPGWAGQASQSTQRALVKKSDELFLAAPAPTSPAVAPMTGLWNVDDIEDGGEVADDLDKLIDLIATLEANGATPNMIVTDPVSWARLRKLKQATDSNESLLGAGTTDAQRLLLDLPVRTSSALSAGQGLVIDSTAIVSAVSQVEVAQSDHVFFQSDSVALRATLRQGHVVPRPDRLGKFTVADADAGA